VFKGFKSWFHFFLGLVVHVNYGLGLVITLAFLIYQLREKESNIEKIGDFLEFTMGFILGYCIKNISP